MGCHCHESVLQGIKDYSARRAKLISVGVVGGVCPWACRRGVALVCGEVDNIVDDIARLPLRMDVRFLHSDGQKRAVLLTQSNALAQQIRDPIILKFKAMLCELPGSVVGYLGAYFGHVTCQEVSDHILHWLLSSTVSMTRRCPPRGTTLFGQRQPSQARLAQCGNAPYLHRPLSRFVR